MSMDEEHCLAAARRGDRSAFRPLAEAHARPLFALCMRITRDSMLAEDAVQEALFNAWRHLANFDGRASFKTWLHRIAVNAALEQLRRHGTQVLANEQGSDDESDDDFLETRTDAAPGPDQHAQGSEVGRQIEEQLARMSMIERTAFVMRHHEGESLEAIGQTLSLNTSASKQAIFRAVRKLRDALQPIR
ncbi:MAG: RNA polymerase sigma factor [Dokdonella sp.]